MNFEEQILMELKAEYGARVERRRRTRRLMMVTAAAGLAAVAAIAVPLLTGSESAAYAISKNDDGTIRVELHEFRDADKLEQDLKDLGVNADITYLNSRQICARDRGQNVDSPIGKTPEEWEKTAVRNVARPNGRGMDIDPRHISSGQTLVMEVSEEGDSVTLGTRLIVGEVRPCNPMDDPTWEERKAEENRQPAEN
ncbi:hypothetical protein SAMN05421833_12023 [Microbispora rosea]|uniref:Uncharacterized protein n=1 Tax=Microbispora rosea TaxID=58117 RepID=A0A1N7EZW8_9ACTN|nr:hypothetical protein [Microbispora rosea]GIH48719.1 hypothetical protein Mro03_38980 [Microbispora rosea subsp. rosea]SIR93683.1 hypothetical protein SAMN05421833_12023 [Microbispora rosea]